MKSNIKHLDAGESVFFKRQLEYVKSNTYDTKYKNLKAKQLIPVSSEAPSGASEITWYSYSKVGLAKIISDYANDFPRVDLFAEEQTAKVFPIGSSYAYSIPEIRRSQRAGINLDTRKANAARRAVEEKIDSLALTGDSDRGIQGLINYTGITEYSLSGGVWSGKTSAQIVADLQGLLDAISVPTKGVEEADTILLPRAQYNLIKTKLMGTDSTESVLSFFLKTNPGIMIEILDELDGAGAAGADRMMAYVRDPEHLTLEIPQPFEQLDADKEGMAYTIPCHAECAGVIVYYPQSVAFADGI